jgi:two-component system sensor histidine kinase HydH
MALLTQSALLVAITSFSMGISVLARRTTNRLAQRYFLLCLVIWAGFFAFFLKTAYQDPFFSGVQLLAWAWLGPSGMELFPLLLGSKPRGWRPIRLISWLLASALSGMVVAGWISEARGGFWLQLLWFAPGVLLLQTVVLLVSLRPLSIRDGLILLGGVFTLIATPLDHAPWLGTTIPAIGNLWFCAYLMLLGQSITRRKILDLQGLFVRLGVLVVLALALTGLYLLVATWSEAGLGVFLLHSFAVSFLIVLLLEPLQDFVAFLSGKILLQARSKQLKLDLAEVERELRSIQDPVSWQHKLEESLCRIFRAAQSGWVRHPERSGYPGAVASEVLRRHAMNELGILAVDLIDRDLALSGSRRERERLEVLSAEMAQVGAQVIVPFFDEDLLGFVWVSKIEASARLTPWGSAILLSEVDGFSRRIGPLVRTMLRIRSLAEQERLATLGELSAGLAHEVRNPLGAIRGALNLMPQGQWTAVIEQETARLEGLVRQFLELSRKREAARVEMEWLDPALWLRQVRTRLESRDVSWSEEGWAQGVVEGLGVVGDPERLMQLVENWIRNSRQAGATQVRVGLQASQDLREVAIFVEDNGHGISGEDLQKIFIPFFTTRREGTGLGLSICDHIAHDHEGRIQVTSTEGNGSRFELWLTVSRLQEGRTCD